MTINLWVFLNGAQYLHNLNTAYLNLPFLGGFSSQAMNESPLKPWGQVQAGEWLNTVHIAFCPQLPGHGSRHFIFLQAKLDGQSWLMTHSGRQFGGSPRNPGMQLQDGPPFTSRQIAFSPHGFGRHGYLVSGGSCIGSEIK